MKANTPPWDELLNRAFRLAYFILGERQSALAVATEATARLDVAARAQRKRRYYSPRGSSRARAARTKVTLSDLQLLQRLVYIESDPLERAQEERAEGGPGDEEMVIRFIKHLARITVKRNSFYVALGLCRILHDYPTHAALDLYGVVLGDPDRLPDDDYCRARKRSLMTEIKERFGGRLETVRGAHGEERFAAREPEAAGELARRCLRRFLPWESSCELPADFDPCRDEIQDLRFRGDDPDQENPVEVRRIHALMNPSYFARLVGALGLGEPREHLTVPHFSSLGATGDGDSGEGRGAPTLSADELAAARHELGRRRGERRRVPACLRVRIDGEDRGQIDPESRAPLLLSLRGGEELVEVLDAAPPGEALLATFLLQGQPPGNAAPRRHGCRLEGGMELYFDLRHDADGDPAVLEVVCRPLPNLAAVLSGWMRKLLGAEAPGRRLAWAGGLMALVVAAVLVFEAPIVESPTSEAPVFESEDSEPSASSPAPQAEAPAPQPAVTRSPQGSPRDAPNEASLSLERIYLPASSLEGEAGALLRELAGLLRAAGVRLVEGHYEADVALRRVRLEEVPRLALISAQGAVLWSAIEPSDGTPRERAESLAQELLAYLQSP